MGWVVKRREPLNFWERIYIIEALRGVWITASHFFRNISIHIAHRFGFLKNVPGAVTIQYPEEKRPTSPRLRTRHRLTQREDGSPRCVACMLCETVCPAKCIYIIGAEHPDPNIEKYPVRFDIDLGMCVYCGYCVEVCPEDAIRMDTQMHEIAAYSRDEMYLDMNELLNPGSRKKAEPYAGAPPLHVPPEPAA